MRFRPVILGAACGLIALALLTGCATTSSPASYSTGEAQHGYASWYGNRDSRHTASGERFDETKLTAAHRHFPFGTIVRVTNEQNGRTVDVRINDRGPWTGGGRIIDLSSAAADVLDMKRAGVIPVDVEILQVGDGHRVN